MCESESGGGGGAMCGFSLSLSLFSLPRAVTVTVATLFSSLVQKLDNKMRQTLVFSEIMDKLA